MILATSLLLLTGVALSGAAGINEPRTVPDESVDPESPKRSQYCPMDWDEYGSRCFKFLERTMPWIEGEKYCLSIGGNLASLHSEQEHYYLQRLIYRTTGSYPHVWLGASNAVEVNTWLWSDGSRFDYYSWEHGQPDNAYGQERCLHMNGGVDRGWHDYLCAASLYIVCSRDK